MGSYKKFFFRKYGFEWEYYLFFEVYKKWIVDLFEWKKEEFLGWLVLVCFKFKVWYVVFGEVRGYFSYIKDGNY